MKALNFPRVFSALLALSVAGPAYAQFPQNGGQNPPVAPQISVKAPQAQAAQSLQPQRTPSEEAMLRGDLLMIRRQYSDAIRTYTDLARKEPKNAAVLNKIGIAYYSLNDLDMAKRYYERSIKADPTIPEVQNNLGVVWYRRKNFKRAVNIYLKAIKLYPPEDEPRPGLSSVYSNLGYAYFGLKKFDEALESFQRALAIDPLVFERRSAGGAGTLLQERSIEERAYFLFFVAKSYALIGNAERCAHYLKRAHEEGYKGLAAVEKDPAFAEVIKDPQVREVLSALTTASAAPPRP
jgi:tetratricopeptide (TPR) repeat protein